MLNSKLENWDKEEENSIELETQKLEEVNLEIRNSKTWDKEEQNSIKLGTRKLERSELRIWKHVSTEIILWYTIDGVYYHILAVE